MNPIHCLLLFRYGLAVVSVILATAVRMLLDPWLGDRIPFITLFAAIIIIARYGGVGPSLVGLVLGSLSVAFFLLPPRYSFAIQDAEYQIGLLLFVLIGLGSALLFESVHKAQRHAGAKQLQLEAEILERKALEANLRIQEEWFRVTLSSIGDAVIATDTHGNVTFLNGTAQAMTGWTEKEAKGVPLGDVFKIINEETRQPVVSPVAKALQEGVVVGLANDTVLIAKDHTERPIDDSAAPIRDSHGQIVGVVLVFRSKNSRRNWGATSRSNNSATPSNGCSNSILSASAPATPRNA